MEREGLGLKEGLEKEFEQLTEKEVEVLLDSLKGVFKTVRIINPERIPNAMRTLGETYDELGV